MRARSLTALVLSLALLAGCENNLRTAGQLNANPQVLAIEADPPDVAPGDSVSLRALLHWPDGTPSLVWMVCIPNVGDSIRTCLANAFAQNEQPPLCSAAPEARFCIANLGSTMQYTVPLDAFPDDGERHTFFVNLLATDSMDGIETCGAVLAGGAPTQTCLLAIKRVAVQTGTVHNENPAIAFVSIGGAAVGPGDLVLDPAAAGKAVEDYRVKIGVQVDAATVDELTPAEGEPAPVDLVASWFSDCGEIDAEKVFVPCAPADGTDPATCDLVESTWRPKVSGTCHLHVVVRDGNGGTGWLSKTVEVR